MRGRVSQAEVPQLVVYSPIACSASCGFEPVNDRTTSTIKRGPMAPGLAATEIGALKDFPIAGGNDILQLSVVGQSPGKPPGATSGLASHGRPALDAAVVLCSQACATRR